MGEGEEEYGRRKKMRVRDNKIRIRETEIDGRRR